MHNIIATLHIMHAIVYSYMQQGQTDTCMHALKGG